MIPQPDPAGSDRPLPDRPLPDRPLTVIGGFLGAGKTTFLNRLLARARGRYAVLVNDFGAVNVDAGLIADHDGATLRLTNGCVCCSLSDGFIDTLLRVLGEEPPFDAVVIEASGVGDPWAIAEIALVDPGLTLAGVVVLTDAERIAALLRDERLGDTVARQVRAADLVVLNKLDLVDEAGREAARAALRATWPGLRIVEAVHAALPEDLIGLVRAQHPAPRGAELRPAAEARHEDLFQRITYRRAGCLDPVRLPAALAALPASLLRLKGACAVARMAGPQLLQMVGRRWTLAPAPPALAGAWPIELVGIGQDVDETEIACILDRVRLTGDDGATLPRTAREPEEDAACP